MPSPQKWRQNKKVLLESTCLFVLKENHNSCANCDTALAECSLLLSVREKVEAREWFGTSCSAGQLTPPRWLWGLNPLLSFLSFSQCLDSPPPFLFFEIDWVSKWVLIWFIFRAWSMQERNIPINQSDILHKEDPRFASPFKNLESSVEGSRVPGPSYGPP